MFPNFGVLVFHHLHDVFFLALVNFYLYNFIVDLLHLCYTSTIFDFGIELVILVYTSTCMTSSDMRNAFIYREAFV